jgi:hypothetical protein
MDNPYTPMFDWLQEEEIDIEAMIEAIASLQNLYETYERLTQKISSLDTDLKGLRSGRKSIKSMFSFKSKEEDVKNIETEKLNSEKSLLDLEGVVKLATYNIDSYIEYFKVEKLAGYYHNLKLFAELQKTNSLKINELWECVSQDKNVKALDPDENDN